MILLIDNYDSFTYNLKQGIESKGFNCVVYRNDEITLEEICRLSPNKIVISPGPGHPAEAGISVELVQRFFKDIPILGVCLGHQSIGYAFGAEISLAPSPKHGKLSKIYHSQGHVSDTKGHCRPHGDLFERVVSPFQAARYHSLVIDSGSLPSCLAVTATTEDGIIMGIRHRQYPVYGLQFHPESIATEKGILLIENFLNIKKLQVPNPSQVLYA